MYNRRFAVEMANSAPNLLSISRVGHDMDDAVCGGLGDIFQNAHHLFCTQHIQEADVRHLQMMGANQSTIKHIIADIYGSHVGLVEEFGLADADDEEDFDVKYLSLKPIWDSLAPGFHDWFLKHREEIFKKNLVQTARVKHNVTGRYYSNGLESHHRLIKKELSENGNPKSVEKVNEILYNRIDKYYCEVERAIRGIGEYRLAPGYEQFSISVPRWIQWSSARKQQHMEKFFNYVPKAVNQYKRPPSAGHKAVPRKKHRSEQVEPEFSVDRVQPNMPPTQSIAASDMPLTPTTAASDIPTCSKYSDPLNPERQINNDFYLVHRRDHKNCPAKTKRCYSCKRLFTDTDWVVVKTDGEREYTNNQGKVIKSHGNVYLHYLSGCLKEFTVSRISNLI